MKRVFAYLKPFYFKMAVGLLIKVLGTFMDLGLPWVLAFIIDDIIPLNELNMILLWGLVMIALSVGARTFNVIANRMAAKVARDTTEALRHDLFEKDIEPFRKTVKLFYHTVSRSPHDYRYL